MDISTIFIVKWTTISGGSIIKYICGGLPSGETDWTKWKVFFCDDRYVPLDDADSNYGPYKEGLFDKVGMGADNVFHIDPSLPCL